MELTFPYKHFKNTSTGDGGRYSLVAECMLSMQKVLVFNAQYLHLKYKDTST